MAKTDLLKEAIADAKAVRETALANAKIALEEAFTPRIQSMLSAKLSEEEGMEDEAPAEEPVAESEDGMEGESNTLDTLKEDDMEEPAATIEVEPEMEEDMEGPAMEPEMEEPAMEGDEDLELEAILRELEAEEPAMEEPVAEQSDSTKIGTGDNKMDVADAGDEEDPGKGKLKENEDKEEVTENEEGDDVSLDEIISALKEDEGEAEEETVAEGEGDEAAKDLDEAYTVIKFLKSKINEVNLLNAKLLFSNKLFRNHSLNEGQKMKVIENFDRAQSLREVKLVFATLSESFGMNGRKAKRTIKESYASKPSRSTAPKKQVISEGSTLSARWKKLANL